MGKFSLLRWVERHEPQGWPVAWIKQGAGLSPAALVAEAARKVGRHEVVEALTRGDATAGLALQKLKELLPLVLLLDDADKLATAGEGFTEGFFDGVRGEVEDRRLTWISTSRQDLFELFRKRGLISEFLNSSTRIWLGPLEEDEARRLADMGPRGPGERLLREAGGFAYGLQWLGRRLQRGEGSVEEVCADFRLEMAEHIFRPWWEALSPRARALLRACARPEGLMEPEDEASRMPLRELTRWGLVSNQHGRLCLAPGDAWKEFVRRER